MDAKKLRDLIVKGFDLLEQTDEHCDTLVSIREVEDGIYISVCAEHEEPWAHFKVSITPVSDDEIERIQEEV